MHTLHNSTVDLTHTQCYCRRLKYFVTIYCLGGWSSWTTYSCSTSCGGGQALRLRSCKNPVPVFGGNQCRGQSLEFVACNTHPCHSKYMYLLIFIF